MGFILQEKDLQYVYSVNSDKVREIYGYGFNESLRSLFDTSKEYSRAEVLGIFKDHLINTVFKEGKIIFGDVYHANGIGNNCEYKVKYSDGNSLYEIGCINVNHNMFGWYYLYITDHNEGKAKLTKPSIRVRAQ